MKKKIIKWGVIIVTGGLIIGGGSAFYLFNMPHRNIQEASADFQLNAEELVTEYLKDENSANEKYLAEDGDSKIIAVTGIIASINVDMNNQKVVLLKKKGENAGVSCTFMTDTNANIEHFQKGDLISIKGVIRSGAGYDKDLELYEDVILEKCDIV